MFVATTTNAQASKDECIKRYNFFRGDYQTKKYTEAKAHLDWLLTNCPKLSLSLYQNGRRLAVKSKDNDLYKKVYEMRLANFPDKGVAKAHSDYVTHLAKNKLGSDDEMFSILEKAYAISPKDMSATNIFRFFKGVLGKYKDSDTQRVFDTYDNVVESVGEKLEYYRKKMAPLLEKEAAGTLSAKEAKKLRGYKINSKASGQVEGGLDAMLESIATCDRLIPLLTRDFDAKSSDAVWLRRSVSRLHNKGCQSDPLYAKLARAYAEASPSADAYNFLAGVLEKNGDASGASQMREKAFSLETDPNKKARLKLVAAFEAESAGRKSAARALANEALQFDPSLGKAYLLIARLYAKSANSCGTSVFQKRMVYVAALNKARKAQQVDPGCGADRYIASYRRNVPSKKDIFSEGVASGSSHRVGCWIGETVRVP